VDLDVATSSDPSHGRTSAKASRETGVPARQKSDPPVDGLERSSLNEQ